VGSRERLYNAEEKLEQPTIKDCVGEADERRYHAENLFVWGKKSIFAAHKQEVT